VKSASKSTGLIRILSVRSGHNDGVLGRLVEKTLFRPNTDNDDGFWLNEAIFYISLSDQLNSSDLRVPRLYGLDITETQSRIVLEYMDGCRPAASEPEFCKAASVLGTLAARSSRVERSHVEWLPYRAHHVSLESLALFEELTAGLAARFPATRGAREKFEQFIAEYEPLGTRRRRAAGCLCHGDAHGGNLMLAEHGQGVVLLDWSHVEQGHFGDDLVSLLSALIFQPLLWDGDINVANRAILEAYCAGMLAVMPQANVGVIKRSYTIAVILFFLTHAKFLLDCLAGPRDETVRLVRARRIARLLVRHAAAAETLAAAVRNATASQP
jgi:hypothetical protein